MKTLTMMTAALLAVVAPCAVAAPFEHAVYESVSIDGAWEMAYRPQACGTADCPKFTGVVIRNAVPSYWEDVIADFRAAGMKDEFRPNPWHAEQTFPIRGQASDTTLPQIFGCFLYRRTVELDRADAAVLRFEGVRNQVRAWANGRFIGFRAGFSTPFELSVPKGVLRKGANEIVLEVSNERVRGYDDYVGGLTTRAIFRAIVDVASSVKFPIRQAMLFEYRVGKGRLLVCSFRFSEGDPASAWLRNALVGYAGGGAVRSAAGADGRAACRSPRRAASLGRAGHEPRGQRQRSRLVGEGQRAGAALIRRESAKVILPKQSCFAAL